MSDQGQWFSVFHLESVVQGPYLYMILLLQIMYL